MAEARNSFIKSKMNRDLDARLVPPGEYRDAQNVSVSKSEGADVGSLENILGNISLTDFGLTAANIDVVGFFMDLNNNRIFVFMSNYVDTSSDRLSNFAPAAAECHIGVYITSTSTGTILVSGRFLNFSKASPILGVNLINDNLFFTDNRNQPRKINVSRALGSSTYYTNEDQISLSKYYPYEPISLVGALVTGINRTGVGTGYVIESNCQTTGGTGSGIGSAIVVYVLRPRPRWRGLNHWRLTALAPCSRLSAAPALFQFHTLYNVLRRLIDLCNLPLAGE